VNKRSVKIIVPRFFPDLKFLAVSNRKFGKFTAPAGKLEVDEDDYDAARRELKEETDIKLNYLFKLTNIIHPGFIDKSETWDCNIFITFTAQEPKQVETGTIPSWKSWAEFETDSLFPQLYKDLKDTVFDTIENMMLGVKNLINHEEKCDGLIINEIKNLINELGFSARITTSYSTLPILEIQYKKFHIASFIVYHDMIQTNLYLNSISDCHVHTFYFNDPKSLENLKNQLLYWKSICDQYSR